MTKKMMTLAAFLTVAAAALLVTPFRNAIAQVVNGYVMTNGQIIVGSTGAAPVAATLTGTANQVSVTNGAGSITLALPSPVAFPGAARPLSQTIAQLQAATPVVGDTYTCSNCSPVKLVVATGTSAGNFADAVGGAFK